MDSNLFQLASSTLCKTKRWVLVTWGLEITYFQASVGQFFFVSDSFYYRIASMPPCRRQIPLYMTDRIRTRAAIVEVIKLKNKIYRSSGTLVAAKLTKASERLQYLLQLLRYRGVDTSRLLADPDPPNNEAHF